MTYFQSAVEALKEVCVAAQEITDDVPLSQSAVEALNEVCEAAQGGRDDDVSIKVPLKVQRTLQEAFNEVCEAASDTSDTSDDSDSDDVPLSLMKVRRTLKGIVQS